MYMQRYTFIHRTRAAMRGRLHLGLPSFSAYWEWHTLRGAPRKLHPFLGAGPVELGLRQSGAPIMDPGILRSFFHEWAFKDPRYGSLQQTKSTCKQRPNNPFGVDKTMAGEPESYLWIYLSFVFLLLPAYLPYSPNLSMYLHFSIYQSIDLPFHLGWFYDPSPSRPSRGNLHPCFPRKVPGGFEERRGVMAPQSTALNKIGLASVLNVLAWSHIILGGHIQPNGKRLQKS